jgi:hypothetical protein
MRHDKCIEGNRLYLQIFDTSCGVCKEIMLNLFLCNNTLFFNGFIGSSFTCREMHNYLVLEYMMADTWYSASTNKMYYHMLVQNEATALRF